MEKKTIDWEERFFQVCLALLARPISRYQGFCDSPILTEIIRDSENMIRLLQEREQKLEVNTKYETKIDSNVSNLRNG